MALRRALGEEQALTPSADGRGHHGRPHRRTTIAGALALIVLVAAAAVAVATRGFGGAKLPRADLGAVANAFASGGVQTCNVYDAQVSDQETYDTFMIEVGPDCARPSAVT